MISVTFVKIKKNHVAVIKAKQLIQRQSKEAITLECFHIFSISVLSIYNKHIMDLVFPASIFPSLYRFVLHDPVCISTHPQDVPEATALCFCLP